MSQNYIEVNYFLLHFWQNVKLQVNVATTAVKQRKYWNIMCMCACHVLWLRNFWHPEQTSHISSCTMCVWVNDCAVLTFKEQQTRGNVLLHLCITMLTWKTLLPIRSVCVCVKGNAVPKSSSKRTVKCLFHIRKIKFLFENQQ